MQPPMTFEICHALTQLARQLLEAGEHATVAHVLAEGQVYSVALTLEPVPTEQLPDVIQRYC